MASAQQRQAGVVDAEGRAASHTGRSCFAWAGGRTGRDYAAQGNILAGSAVVDGLADTFEAGGLPFPELLVACLAAADAAGGDRRGRQSAALLVVREGGGYGGGNDRWIDLRVDDHADPVGELGRLLALTHLYAERPTPAELVALDVPLAGEIRDALGRLGWERRGPPGARSTSRCGRTRPSPRTSGRSRASRAPSRTAGMPRGRSGSWPGWPSRTSRNGRPPRGGSIRRCWPTSVARCEADNADGSMTRSAPWELRRASGADAAAVAAMHIRAWQVAYRGIIPDRYLDGLDVGARAGRYSFDLAGPADPTTWIAADGNDVVGMVAFSPSRDEDLPELGEVQALYVAPEQWRSGAGSALMAKAERLLIDAGFTEAALWVLEDNSRAAGSTRLPDGMPTAGPSRWRSADASRVRSGIGSR